jgi:N-acetylmuramoyl-L-alanine amidase
LAGDRLHIPPLRPKTVAAASDQRHGFRRKGIPVSFELALTENEEPLAGASYVLILEGDTVDEGELGADGVISIPMSPETREGELRVMVNGSERVYPLLFGELDPPQTASGACARLQNLGYTASDDEEALQLALKRFQKDQQLADSGELDDATAAKLAEVHGS